MRKHKPYGTYKGFALEYPRMYGDFMDCQESQDSIAQGFRIRNKKAKRRMMNKKTRQAAINSLRKEVENV